MQASPPNRETRAEHLKAAAAGAPPDLYSALIPEHAQVENHVSVRDDGVKKQIVPHGEPTAAITHIVKSTAVPTSTLPNDYYMK